MGERVPLVCSRFTSVGKSDVGKKRPHNEDRIFLSDPMGLYVVADGMGGHHYGEVASALAVKAMESFFVAGENGESTLKKAIEGANDKIIQEGKKLLSESEKEIGMGTTIVSLALFGETATIAHVGDSRAYRIRNGQLIQLTEDHSVLAMVGREYGLVAGSRFKGVLSRALGVDPDVEVDVRQEAVVLGDIFLLCSDGLTNMVSDLEIEAILNQNKAIDSACEALIQRANQQGGVDNISAVLVQCNGI